MKYAIWAVAIIISFFVGYFIMYPIFRGVLITEKGVPSPTSQALQEVKYGAGSRELLITINLETIEERELHLDDQLQDVHDAPSR